MAHSTSDQCLKPVPFAIVDDPICAILGHARQRHCLFAVLTVQIEDFLVESIGSLPWRDFATY